MSANLPPQDPAAIDNAVVNPEQEIINEAAPVVDDAAAAQVTADGTEAPAAQEGQVLDAVAEGLAAEEITAEDIIMAMLMDNFGLSSAGAQSLFNLLMTDLAQDAAAAQPTPDMAAAPAPTPNDVVPPEAGV